MLEALFIINKTKQVVRIEIEYSVKVLEALFIINKTKQVVRIEIE